MQFFCQCQQKFSALILNQRSWRPRVLIWPSTSTFISVYKNFSLVPNTFFFNYTPFQFNLKPSSLLSVHASASSQTAFLSICPSLKARLHSYGSFCTSISNSPAKPKTMATSADMFLFTNIVASANAKKRASAPHPITVCIEGNIGSGKTTLLKQLALQPNVEIMEEPVEKWRNFKGNNLLSLMYSDPKRWSYLFQAYVQLTMMQHHLQPSSAEVKILERSIHSARHCFVENMYQSKLMSEPEYNVYCEWYSTITNYLDVPVDLIVYLSASPELSQQRIRERGRAEEAEISLSYLSELHELHGRWLADENLPAPLLVLSADLTLDQMRERVEERIDALLQQRREKDSHAKCSTGTASFSDISPSKRPANLLPASASN